MVSLGVGAYLFTISMAEYIHEILNSINERAKQEDENQMKDIVGSLADFIEIYTILKELSEVYSIRFLNLYNLTNLTMFPSCSALGLFVIFQKFTNQFTWIYLQDAWLPFAVEC